MRMILVICILYFSLQSKEPCSEDEDYVINFTSPKVKSCKSWERYFKTKNFNKSYKNYNVDISCYKKYIRENCKNRIVYEIGGSR